MMSSTLPVRSGGGTRNYCCRMALSTQALFGTR